MDLDNFIEQEFKALGKDAGPMEENEGDSVNAAPDPAKPSSKPRVGGIRKLKKDALKPNFGKLKKKKIAVIDSSDPKDSGPPIPNKLAVKAPGRKLKKSSHSKPNFKPKPWAVLEFDEDESDGREEVKSPPMNMKFKAQADKKKALNTALAKGPDQLQNIRPHDISQRKNSNDSYGDDGYEDGFDSDTDVKIKPKPIVKATHKLAVNPMKFKLKNKSPSPMHNGMK